MITRCNSAVTSTSELCGQKLSSNPRVNFASLSRSRKQNRCPASPARGAGCGPAGRPSRRRSWRSPRTMDPASSSSMKNSTYSRRSQMVSTVKKVTRQDSRGLLTEEHPPGGGGRPRCRGQPVSVQRRSDRRCRDPRPEAQQLALDALIAPARILLGQTNDELLHLIVERRCPTPGAGRSRRQ